MYRDLTLHPVGHICSPYKEKFGIPRQSGLVSGENSWICLEKEYDDPDCFRGMEEYSHLWLIWAFSDNNPDKWSPTVRPPRLGGNERKGVFASRSPFRPNPLGLSCVLLNKIDINADREHKVILYVSGADLMDGTPIYDIKPYLPYTDSHPDASYVFAKRALSHKLTVHYDQAVLAGLSETERQELIDSLSLDPRPSYHKDPERIYGMKYLNYNVRFQVKDTDLFILSI